MAPHARWHAGLGDAVCLGLAAGFYLWMAGGPRPADPAIVRTTQTLLVEGLPLMLLLGLAGGLAVVAMLSVSPAARAWTSTLALASCMLYSAAAVVALGRPAIVLAPACALASFIALATLDERPRGGAVLLTLHAGALGTALAFFHQWSWYRAGWEPFLDSIVALRKLWLSL